MNKTTTTARIRYDGTVVEIRADGTEQVLPDTPMRPMTEAEIAAAAAADPDARPMTTAQLRTARSPQAVRPQSAAAQSG